MPNAFAAEVPPGQHWRSSQRSPGLGFHFLAERGREYKKMEGKGERELWKEKRGDWSKKGGLGLPPEMPLFPDIIGWLGA